MKSTVTMVQAINWAIDDAMAADEKVIMLGEDIADPEGGGVVGISKGLSTKYGDERVKSTPISEQAIIGAAIGAALIGYKPIAEIMLMNFTTVAMDMIVNHAAKLRFMSGGQTSVPITIHTMTGAGVGNGGQHSDFLESWFAHTAGMKVVIPSTPADAYGLLRSCIDDPDPCMFIETMPILWNPGPPPERNVSIPLGKADLKREGKDVTIIAYGRPVLTALMLAEKFAAEDISVEVLDLMTVSPFDRAAIRRSVGKTRAAVIVHDAVKQFGVGAEIAAFIHEDHFDHPVKVLRVGAKYAPVPFSKPLEAHSLPETAEIEAAIRRLVAVGRKTKEVVD